MRVVQLCAQKSHPALASGLVVEHRLLFTTTSLFELAVARLVVEPRLAGADPATFDSSNRTIDIEDLEHHLQSGATKVHQWLERRGRLGPFGIKDVNHSAHQRLGREGDGGEVTPDVGVLRAGQQDDLGTGTGPARAADLLVVGDRR